MNMAKRNIFNPFIFLEDTPGTPGDDVVVGGKTGQGGVEVHAYPMSFGDWQNSEWVDDYILDGDINMDDYAVWWEFCGFTFQQWIDAGNTEEDWNTYFG